MKIKIVCDSLCDIPQEIANKEYIEIVPLRVLLEGKTYKDGIDISKEELYKIMKTSEILPKTSHVTEEEFSKVFQNYIDQDYEIICITGSSKSSRTFSSASLAKENIKEGKDRIHLFDTLNLSLGSGQYVIKACELREKEFKSEEIIENLEKLRDSVCLLFAPSTLDYIYRGGRVSVTTATIGSMLNLKPILSFPKGEAKIIEKVRGTKAAITKMIDILIEKNNGNFEDKIITIGYGDNIEEFKELEAEVKERIKAKKIYFTKGGACICTHTGPEILAISCSQ